MKNQWFSLFFSLFLLGCINNKKSNIQSVSGTPPTRASSDSLFEYYYKTLDSLGDKNPFDTSKTCHDAIKFMETFTKIKASEDANLIGVILYNRKDLIAWREWYNKNRKK